jgi:hypothetical protein
MADRIFDLENQTAKKMGVGTKGIAALKSQQGAKMLEAAKQLYQNSFPPPVATPVATVAPTLGRTAATMPTVTPTPLLGRMATPMPVGTLTP